MLTLSQNNGSPPLTAYATIILAFGLLGGVAGLLIGLATTFTIEMVRVNLP